jgi:hypothetical protein
MKPKTTPPSRRRFAKTLSAALLAAPLAASFESARAQTPPASTPTPAPSPAQAKESPLVEAYMNVARAQFGDKLSAEAYAKLRRDIAGNVGVSERLSAVKLKNSDEPDFVFQV